MSLRQLFKRSEKHPGDRQKALGLPPLDGSAAWIESYRANGFLKIENLLTSSETGRYKSAVDRLLDSSATRLRNDEMFLQVVNNWTQNQILRELTLLPALHRLALGLAGVPLRLWHDQLLVKEPGSSRPTEFHQDFPYWPFQPGKQTITAWIALVDVPVERGCLSFIPGSHRLGVLPEQDLTDARSLFQLRPELEWQPRVAVPLRAGDCTFHNGCTAHMAFANQTPERRIGFAVIFMEEGMKFSGAPHVMSDPLGLAPGDPIAGELFPPAGGGA